MARWAAAATLFIALTMVPAASAPLVSDAWIRAMPGTTPAAGYFTLANTGPKPLTLIGVQSPACGMAMMHKSEIVGGVARMTMVDRVDVPARGRIVFAPGGYHIMCMDPVGLKPGGQVSMVFAFGDGSSLTVSFAVRSATGR